MESLLKKVLAGDLVALSGLMTKVEEGRGEIHEALQKLYDSRKGTIRIGLTGPPGAGKSTIANQFIGVWRKMGHRVGVVAIDPTSPFTGGALLGDRVRMMEHATDAGVFIRSLGSRGAQGGISRAAGDIALCLGVAGFDRIIIESVGVGQTEFDIAKLVELTIVVLVPEAGDAIQVMKAGLLEIADIVVVNKADRDGAGGLASAIEAEVHCPVLLVEAVNGKGIKDLIEAIEGHHHPASVEKGKHHG